MTDRIVDVAIVGGAVVGASVAFWLTRLAPHLSIVVIERDRTYARAATTLSASAIRQQFSDPHNIALSRFGVAVIREWEALVGPDAPALGFRENGYLYLASPAQAREMEVRATMQRRHGAETVWFGREALAERFPYLAADGIGGGSWGARGEGWFNSHALMQGFQTAAQRAGVPWIAAEVTRLSLTKTGADLTLSGGDRVAAGVVVNAAGPGAGRLAALAGLDLPVEPRKRHVFTFDCRESLPLDMPQVIDVSGLYVRPEGTGFLTGIGPEIDGPADPEDFEPDPDLFETRLWPILAARIPAFEAIRLRTAWAGHYDFNPIDHNAIIGPRPDVPQVVFANGFSGHGLQQAAAAGRGVAEWIAFGRYATLDLSPFRYARLAEAATPERAVI